MAYRAGMDREIETILPAQRIIDDGDMLLYRALPSRERISVGPFVFVDHYRHRSRRGIGDKPHPHAGIEVLSYLLEGGVEHRDSMGFRDRLGPGDAQWIRAGRGILHAEQPAGGRHGLQLWTSLPPAQKLIEPVYASYRAADIPVIASPGVDVRVIAGRVGDAEGPMKMTTPTVFAVARLEAGAMARLALDPAAELGLYVLEGKVVAPSGASLAAGTLAVLAGGPAVAMTADGAAATVALIGGQPAETPILFSGPFVMDSPERLAQAGRDYASGKMGRLDGVPF
jgi:redox-sensitive bicupin YhaK (pirin superfamily)